MKAGDFKITAIQHKSILILDFGSQYTQLIARRLREIGVYCEIHPYYTEKSIQERLKLCGIILSGGPATVTQDANPCAPAWVFTAGVPMLGICYGMQTMATQLGGQVSASLMREFGHAELCVTCPNHLFMDMHYKPTTDGRCLMDVWMSHGDTVTALPLGFKQICSTSNTPIAAMADEARHWYGLQFHPEVTHTPEGAQLLKHFAVDICGASTHWTSKHILEEMRASIRAQVGSDQVLLGLSGGVDSSVAAVLLHQAIGEQLICVFVDTGLLRLHEMTEVKAMFQERLGIQIRWIDAAASFFQALSGVTCPEEKRKIIGALFVEIFEQEAMQYPAVKWLAQGTIYSDVIESALPDAQGISAVIKSHHNVGGLPATMTLQLLEPLRCLFKDEVRQLGTELDLPARMLYRHPFPGPGLGVRILGEVTPAHVQILRQADAIFIEELIAADLYHTVSQAFAVFLPIKSVGVMGDGREYGYVIALRAVETIDFMTARWSHLPWEFLGQVSHRIINEVKGISRVTYDISGKPPATIEWE